ncbi:MAG TPA: nicotinate (nicotinamide) nucleotide adenylyltransferase [Phycisphaerales bacterium]|nr:nicotinate (nicotinamide) nucleotide adenylyltransferase [Phycisphaerales bacterium]
MQNRWIFGHSHPRTRVVRTSDADDRRLRAWRRMPKVAQFAELSLSSTPHTPLSSHIAVQNTPTRILIVGGTFDPPHIAHTRLAQLAADRLGCERIVFVPAHVSPFKAGAPPTDAEHRLAMLALALADVPNAKISTIEIDRGRTHSEKPSYTIDTLRELRTQREFQDAELFLLMGCDQALEFHRWKDWQEILKCARPVVLIRSPWDEAEFVRAVRERYGEEEGAEWIARAILPSQGMPMIDVCATEVRERISQGLSCEGLVEEAVEKYIVENGLYRRAQVERGVRAEA